MHKKIRSVILNLSILSESFASDRRAVLSELPERKNLYRHLAGNSRNENLISKAEMGKTAYFYTPPEGGRMGYTKKSLQELDLIDNFLSNAIASNEEIREPFYRLLLSVLLGKELKEIRVLSQQMIPAAMPEQRGIRLDVEITEYEEGSVTNVYDLEPHLKDALHLPRHNRYYQAKIDGRYVKRGLKDFSKIPNLYIITITNYDLFGKDYMMYTVRNQCAEVPDLEYNDGLQFIYFYTKGQKGGSQAIKNMLTYLQNSDSKNAVDDATRIIDSYVKTVKKLPEVEAGYMTLGDWMDEIEEEIRESVLEEFRDQLELRDKRDQELRDIREQELREELTQEVREELAQELREEHIKVFIETLQKYCDSKQEVEAELQEKYPAYADRAAELVECYWQAG